MLKEIKNHIPRPIKEAARHLRNVAKKELPYLEMHLTDHCNLNCSGCGHYSQMASPNYADLRQYKIDMMRLSQLFRNIDVIRLMGGEPLLHPDPSSFITVTRTNFPRSDLRFVTNGILLPKASASFWEACRNTSTTIDLSLYPPFKQRAADWQNICDRERVNLCITEVNSFHSHMNLEGDSDEAKAFRICRNRFYCPFLQSGRIYTCPKAALVHYFNKEFGIEIVADPGIDIHSPHVSARKILNYINGPIETCRWCMYDYVQLPWSAGKDLVHSWYNYTP
jgi:hypothetical protein